MDKIPKSDSEEEREEGKDKSAEHKASSARSCIIVENSAQKNLPKPSPSKKQCLSQGSTSSTTALPDVTKCNISDKDSISLTGKFKNLEEFKKEIFANGSPTTITLSKCFINTAGVKALPQIITLKNISFENCDKNIFKAFLNQTSLEKIEVHNNDWTWNKFPHKVFNQICKNCKKLDHLVLKGIGTGSYFDCDDFPYKVSKLESTMITFNWYIETKNERVSFLKSQNGKLKELRIDELPYDFDGGRVLKYILENMNLKKLSYGNILLINDWKRQIVKEFTASELQITSAYEMIRQFPSIEKFTLKLSNTDISCEDIEKNINPLTDLFENIKEFEVIDNSRGHLGVFLGLFKNLEKVQKITFKTKDENVIKIINLLPQMENLKEIQLVSNASSLPEIDTLKFAPNFKFTKVMDNDDAEPPGNVGRFDRGDDGNAPRGANVPRENDEDDGRRNRRGGNGGGDDGSNINNLFKDWPQTTIQGTIMEGDGPNQFQSELTVQVLPEAVKYYHYIHAFGFYKIKLNDVNVDQLKLLLGDTLTDLINISINDQGKIMFKLFGDIQQRRDLIHNRIIQLVFKPNNVDVKLPLITLPSNLPITVNFYVGTNMDWEKFRKEISSQNGLSGSFWHYVGTERNEGQGYKLIFDIEGKSYSQIKEMGHELQLDNERVFVEVNNDPYRNDIDNLPF